MIQVIVTVYEQPVRQDPTRRINVITFATNYDDRDDDDGIGHNAIKFINIALCAKLIVHRLFIILHYCRHDVAKWQVYDTGRSVTNI